MALDNESIKLLQKIDCNCSDCKFMARDSVKFNASTELHYKWQLDDFNRRKDRLNNLVDKKYRDQELVAGYQLEQEYNKMKFQFDRNESKLNFGDCTKFSKPVSFIPGVCQLDTQGCFEHRKD